MKLKNGKLQVVDAFLGFLGMAISIAVGFYLLSTLLDLSSIQGETGQIWIASLATTASVASTAYGSYTILNSNAQRGGKINIAGGLVLVITYLYFSEFSQPKLLEWLNPIGIALLIPPILSGVISLMRNPKNQSESINTNQ
jgi:hypothetical protein